MVLEYSFRFRRCATIRPGSGFTRLPPGRIRPAKSSSAFICAGRGLRIPFGGISPARSFARMRSSLALSGQGCGSRKPVTFRPPEDNLSLWQPAQVCDRIGRTADRRLPLPLPPPEGRKGAKRCFMRGGSTSMMYLGAKSYQRVTQYYTGKGLLFEFGNADVHVVRIALDHLKTPLNRFKFSVDRIEARGSTWPGPGWRSN